MSGSGAIWLSRRMTLRVSWWKAAPRQSYTTELRTSVRARTLAASHRYRKYSSVCKLKAQNCRRAGETEVCTSESRSGGSGLGVESLPAEVRARAWVRGLSDSQLRA